MSGASISLDVAEKQDAIDYFDDPVFQWHVRLLMINFGRGRWIWATPDMEVQYGDLAQHRVVPVARAAPYPARLLGNLYAFDPVSAEALEALRREAASLADVLGIDTASLKDRRGPGARALREGGRAGPHRQRRPFRLEGVGGAGTLVESVAAADHQSLARREAGGAGTRLARMPRPPLRFERTPPPEPRPGDRVAAPHGDARLAVSRAEGGGGALARHPGLGHGLRLVCEALHLGVRDRHGGFGRP